MQEQSTNAFAFSVVLSYIKY